MANDEFIREVDEEYRRDKVMQIWSRYNGLIIGLAVVAIICVGGWRYWEHTRVVRSQADATRFEDALKVVADKPQESEQELEALAKEDASGYALLARFRLAAEQGKLDLAKGVATYTALSADPKVPGLWQDLARLRAAWLSFGTAAPGDIRPVLERMAIPTNPWRHSARELLGLSGLKAGEYDFAGKWFDQIAADRETPAGLRQRLEVYSAVVAGGPVSVTQ